MLSRRNFLKNTSGTSALALIPGIALTAGKSTDQKTLTDTEEVISLNGSWLFRIDAGDKGEGQQWFINKIDKNWSSVEVPHTWQINPEHTDYYGTAWYQRSFYAPSHWKDKTIRIEFEAVYHSATVWLNGIKIGEHLRKGYTAFWIKLNEALKFDDENLLVVKVNNNFDDHMLPRGHSYDWAADGGITRPVSLHITSPVYIERILVGGIPANDNQSALIKADCLLINDKPQTQQLTIFYKVIEEKSGKIATSASIDNITVPAAQTKQLNFSDIPIEKPSLWHFDHPDLYLFQLEIHNEGKIIHRQTTLFGIRKLEVKNAGFYLNNERVRLMGVERMAGSDPEYGMAESESWIRSNHNDMKELNCIFTRVHWQQDKRVLEYCDRHGILMQEEVPTWGSATFAGMEDQPSKDIMQNGLEQLEEMIHRDYNHPCIISWGLCNEINGQNPPAYHFAENMLHSAKKLDPYRLCSYASNSLQKTPGKDVAALMDFIEWNEYYQSWYKGTVEDMEKNLQEIHNAFPDKPIVISEYGWCRCAPDRKIGDAKLIEILKSHDAVFRRHDYMGGLIFFCYNDYRTHIGDKGIRVMKQRVHGVVDIFAKRKGSFDILRLQSSPVETLEAVGELNQFKLSFKTRSSIPAYTLAGYTIECIAYADQDIPLEKSEISLPEISPGKSFSHAFSFQTPDIEKVLIKIKRPTGFSVNELTKLNKVY